MIRWYRYFLTGTLCLLILYNPMMRAVEERPCYAMVNTGLNIVSIVVIAIHLYALAQVLAGDKNWRILLGSLLSIGFYAADLASRN